MKFTVSSSELSNVLQYVGKVINPKHTLAILDYFKFELKENKLTITASDLETTQVSSIEVVAVDMEGSILVPSKMILDFLKEFADQPITIDTNLSNGEITMIWETGRVTITGISTMGYPSVTEHESDIVHSFEIPVQELYDGITNTLFAAADKNTRPIMNGICMDIRPDKCVFVATDAHKLVKMTLPKNLGLEQQTMIVIPKKAATLVKAFLAKESGLVKIEVDAKNIFFTINDTTFISRLIEGKFPNYDVVIPTQNPNKVIVDRQMFLNSIKRVSVCANQVTSLVLLKLENNTMHLETKDSDFSVEAHDYLNCSYDGEPMTIGFKYPLLIDILTTLTTTDVVVELSEPTRAGVILPVPTEKEQSYDLLMLLMPIMP